MPTRNFYYWTKEEDLEEAKRAALDYARYLGYESARFLRFSHAEGSPRSAICVHIAAIRHTGTHRPTQEEEIRIKVEYKRKKFHARRAEDVTPI